MKKINGRIISIMVVLLFALEVHAESEVKCESAINKDGIEVFTREVAGSDFYESMGVTTIDARIEVLEEVLKDVPSHTQWVADCREAKVIQVIDDSTKIVYNVTKTPWPVSNREALYISKKNRDYKSGTVVLDITSTDDPAVPVKEGNVRVTELKAQWVLTYIDREHTRVSYTVRSNPGGNIPKSIANMTSKNFPYKTLLGMKKMAKIYTYIEAAKISPESKEIEEYITAGYLKP